MMARFGSYRMLTVVGLSLVIILILLYFMSSFAWEKYYEYGGRSAQLEPRISRLLGVEQSYDLLQKANKRVKTQLTELAYPAARDAAVTSASMQRTVREIVEQAGMSVRGSQILPIKERDGYDRILVDITTSGTLESLEDVLISLREVRPGVSIESINIRPVRVRRKGGQDQKLTVRFKLLSLRLQS